MFALCSPPKIHDFTTLLNKKTSWQRPLFGVYYKYEREEYIMKKLILILAVLWWGLNAFANSVKADDYTKAVIGHVITNHKDIDHAKLLETEMSKMAHKFAIEMTGVLATYLPYIMENAMTQMRLELDKQHKCLLLKDSKIKDKGC